MYEVSVSVGMFAIAYLLIGFGYSLGVIPIVCVYTDHRDRHKWSYKLQICLFITILYPILMYNRYLIIDEIIEHYYRKYEEEPQKGDIGE